MDNKILKKIKRKGLFKKKKNNIIFIIILFIFSLTVLLVLSIYLLYLKIDTNLPDIKKIDNIKIPEASIIYDKNWNELYKIYSEKRIYVPYDKISKNMINAIIAWEDKRFWQNPWYDIIGILRAIIKWVQNGNRIEWTSWITQQLVKIIFLSNERTIDRKIKELLLSIKLTKNYSKKVILELYLNKVFFWWNSYWVEEASQTFFWKNALDLNVLESSILASLPKSPTNFSPYSHKEKLLWYLLISNSLNHKDNYKILSKQSVLSNKKIIQNFVDLINNITFKREGLFIEVCNLWQNNLTKKYYFNDNGCIKTTYSWLLTILSNLYYKNNENIIEYIPGRKDYVLIRMLEDKYIDFDTFKKSLIQSFWYEFNKYVDKIKYPYFVMYVKEYLVNKFWEDILKTWWLKIYTTIDPKLQDKAQQLIEKQVKINKQKYWASNAALISIDNKTGNILAFIWGVNYFDLKNGWNNNMLLARLQPGSTFKPFVYMLAMIKNNFDKNTILTDEEMVFPWWYKPHNSDGTYLGKMTLSKALNYSRNIPAVKIYFAAWEEKEIINFVYKFWIKSLKEFKEYYKKKYWKEYNYGPPMVLWTVQITVLELAKAYSVFANNWIKRKLLPIKKIIDNKWNVIYDSSKYLNWVKIIDKKWAKMMNEILSDETQRPKDWNYFLTIPWRKMAAKTWTSTKQYLEKKWSKDSKWRLYRKRIIFPRDLWTVWYTPQITTVVWAWNTSWKELKQGAYWITWAGPIVRDFMNFAHKDLKEEKW